MSSDIKDIDLTPEQKVRVLASDKLDDFEKAFLGVKWGIVKDGLAFHLVKAIENCSDEPAQLSEALFRYFHTQHQWQERALQQRIEKIVSTPA